MTALVDTLRRVPIFVRIGLMWWIVLFAYPLSRPYLLYHLDLSTSGSLANPLIVLPVVVLGLLSLTHALGASWLGVRLLRWRGCGRSVWSLLAWSAAIAWFAVSTWGMMIAAARLFEAGDSPAQRLDRFTNIVSMSISLLPWVAWTSFWKSTWILLPLAFTTVLIVRHGHVPANRAAEPARSVPS